jgi:type IV secretion system protein VirB6
MNACAPLPEGAGFIRSILAYLDCQAQTLGAGGYQALAASGSLLAMMLTGLLTLYVALFGYRMLMGQGPDLRTGILAFVKLGVVLALATSWQAYRTLAYDVALKGPAEIAATIGAPTGLPGAAGGLVERLDGADQAFVALSVLGEGKPPPLVDVNRVPPQPYPGFNTFAIGGSRMLFLISAIAGLGAVRLIAGLLLAVGPFFIAFLLFDNTRSLLEGWLRVLGGSALAALGTSIALGAELALVEPWLADILARRGAEQWLPGMPVEILVITSVFFLIVLALLYFSAKIAFAFRLAPIWRAATATDGQALRGEERRIAAAAAESRHPSPAEARSRAATISDAVAATQRRESAQVVVASAPAAAGGAGGMAGARRAAPAGPAGTVPSQQTLSAPLGQSFPRRTRGRVSASASRRDRRI